MTRIKTTHTDRYLPTHYSNRELTQMQIDLLDNLEEAGYDPIKAAELAGYKQPKEAIKSLARELVSVVETMIANDALIAAKTLRDIMVADAPILNAQMKLSAANSVLDRAGYAKKEILNINHKVTGGVFILPPKEELKIIEGEVINED